MARPLRLHIPGALYHVMSRGNARQRIFVDDTDYKDFLARLAVTTRRFGVWCLGHCLMDNHFHLVLKPTHQPVSRMMQQLNSGYSQSFNERHGLVGHTLQGRFKALVVERDDYFRRLLRYVALNPVRSGAVHHPADWPWSSYRATAGLDAPPAFLTLDEVWRAFDPSDAVAQRLYARFVLGDDADAADVPEGPVAWGSTSFVADLHALVTSHRRDPDIVAAEKYAGRPSLAQLFTSTADRRVEDAVMMEAFDRYAYTLREIGAFVGKPPATVWRRIRRVSVAPAVGVETEKIEI